MKKLIFLLAILIPALAFSQGKPDFIRTPNSGNTIVDWNLKARTFILPHSDTAFYWGEQDTTGAVRLRTVGGDSSLYVRINRAGLKKWVKIGSSLVDSTIFQTVSNFFPKGDTRYLQKADSTHYTTLWQLLHGNNHFTGTDTLDNALIANGVINNLTAFGLLVGTKDFEWQNPLFYPDMSTRPVTPVSTPGWNSVIMNEKYTGGSHPDSLISVPLDTVLNGNAAKSILGTVYAPASGSGAYVSSTGMAKAIPWYNNSGAFTVDTTKFNFDTSLGAYSFGGSDRHTPDNTGNYFQSPYLLTNSVSDVTAHTNINKYMLLRADALYAPSAYVANSSVTSVFAYLKRTNSTNAAGETALSAQVVHDSGATGTTDLVNGVTSSYVGKGTGSLSQLFMYTASVGISANENVTTLQDFTAANNFSGGGTVTGLYGYRVNRPALSGGSSITNLWGIYVDSLNQAGVTHSYSVYLAGKKDTLRNWGITILGTLATPNTPSSDLSIGRSGDTFSTNHYGSYVYDRSYASSGDTLGKRGMIGNLIDIGDATGTTAATRGRMLGMHIIVSPLIARSIPSHDDATGMNIENGGIVPLVDGIYFARDTLTTWDMKNGITFDAHPETGIRFNGNVQNYGIDFAGVAGTTSYGNGAIRLPNNIPIVSVNAANTGNIQALKVDGSNNVLLGSVFRTPTATTIPAWANNSLASATGAATWLAPTTYTDNSTAGSTTTTYAAGTYFGVPTFAATNTSVTYTNDATVLIAGAPADGTHVTGTNHYALFVPAGAVKIAGALTAGTFNNTNITAQAAATTLTIASGKTLTVNNTVTLAGTDAQTYTFPSASTNVVGNPNGALNILASTQTTLVAGTKALSVTGVTTGSHAYVTLVSASGTSLTTQYQAVCTSGTVTVQANIAAGTINTSDISTVNVFVTN